MLKQRVSATLKFFDLQDIPLTLLEVHKYLLADVNDIEENLNERWELKPGASGKGIGQVSIGEIQQQLDELAGLGVKQFRGHYYLANRDQAFVTRRLENYLYGIKRERLIRRYSKGLQLVPFLRGVGLVGSQALGLYKPSSDIDLLIIVDPKFMWLARLFTTVYFQIFGIRRHGKHAANRFCLNHYLAGPKTLTEDRNIYTASEYVKMRPLYPSAALDQFLANNLAWLKQFFPHTPRPDMKKNKPKLSWVQNVLEKLLDNSFGYRLERFAHRLEEQRIDSGEFIVVEPDELSFHPDNRKEQLFRAFFKSQ
jgi:hypothetical protein